MRKNRVIFQEKSVISEIYKRNAAVKKHNAGTQKHVKSIVITYFIAINFIFHKILYYLHKTNTSVK